MNRPEAGALRARLVTPEPVEDSRSWRIGEVGGGTRGSFGFDPPEAGEIPGGMKDLLKDDILDCATRVELGEQRLLQRGEFLAFVVADDEVPGGQPMADGIA